MRNYPFFAYSEYYHSPILTSTMKTRYYGMNIHDLTDPVYAAVTSQRHSSCFYIHNR